MVYKKIDIQSTDTISDALNLFEPPHTHVAIERAQFKEILTLNPVNETPFHFKISPGSSFIDLDKIYLYTEMKIKKKKSDGTLENIGEADNVAPVQGIGSTFIRNMAVSVGGNQVFNANNLYSYKAYLDTHLTFGMEAKKHYLNAIGYFYDDSGYPHGYYKTGVGTTTEKTNLTGSFKSRAKMFKDKSNVGKSAEFITKLHVDLFAQKRYFLNNTDIEITIHPQSSEFLLVSPDSTEYVLEFAACKLYVKFVDLHAGFAVDVEKILDKTPAKYGMRRTEMKTLYFEPGRTEVHQNLFNDQIPRRIVVALVGKNNFNGKLGLDPFDFDDYDVNNIQVEVNGQRVPSVPYEIDYPNSRYVRPFHDLYDSLGYSYNTEGCGIDYMMYKHGSCIYAFNTTSNLENDESFDLIREGPTSLHIKFAKDIPTGGVNAIVLAEFDSILMIDKSRNVKTDATI